MHRSHEAQSEQKVNYYEYCIGRKFSLDKNDRPTLLEKRIQGRLVDITKFFSGNSFQWRLSHRGGEERVVPFRESKLTRLFQNYFVGTGKGKSLRQGKITMFVNVSNNASVFDETVHVLKFSALTSKVCKCVFACVCGY